MESHEKASVWMHPKFLYHLGDMVYGCAIPRQQAGVLGQGRLYGTQAVWVTPTHSMKTGDRWSLFIQDEAPWINTVKY